MKNAFALVLCLTASPILADGCPASPDHSEALGVLLDQVQAAPNEMVGREISNQMWAYWVDAPDELAQKLLDEGMRARGSYDFRSAISAFDRLVEYCPDYAEGYNQRAFVNFMREDFAAALPDLERALALSPNHVAALAGKGLTLMGLGRNDDAQNALRAAVSLNPWLSERHLLKTAPGQDL